MKPETPLAARAAVRALTASKIRELYNEGIGRSDVSLSGSASLTSPRRNSSARPESIRLRRARCSIPTTTAFRSCAKLWRGT